VTLGLKYLDQLDDTPLEYLVEGILPRAGKVMFTAYAKSGKTTTTLHLIKSLTRGTPFLGRDTKQVEGTVVYMNLELRENNLLQYAKDAGLSLTGRRLLVSQMLGQARRVASMFIPLDELRTADQQDDHQDAIDDLRKADCQVLIIDCLSSVTSVLGDTDSNDDMRRVLEQIDATAQEAGVELLIVVHHTGHEDKTRARGASALIDWPDVTWNLMRAASDDCTLTVGGRIEEAKIGFRLDKDKNLLVPTAKAQVDDLGSEIIRLRRVEKLTEREIANQLGKNQSTIHRRLQRYGES